MIGSVVKVGTSSGAPAAGITAITQTLNNGANTVTHGLGVQANDVTVKNSTGQQIPINWNQIDLNSVNVFVPGGGPITNAIISIETT